MTTEPTNREITEANIARYSKSSAPQTKAAVAQMVANLAVIDAIDQLREDLMNLGKKPTKAPAKSPAKKTAS